MHKGVKCFFDLTVIKGGSRNFCWDACVCLCVFVCVLLLFLLLLLLLFCFVFEGGGVNSIVYSKC